MPQRRATPYTPFEPDGLDRKAAELAASLLPEEERPPRLSHGTLAVWLADEERWNEYAEMLRNFQLSRPVRLVLVHEGGKAGFPETPAVRVSCVPAGEGERPFCVEEVLLPAEPGVEETLNDLAALSDPDLPFYLFLAVPPPAGLCEGAAEMGAAFVVPAAGDGCGSEAGGEGIYGLLPDGVEVYDLRWPAVLSGVRKVIERVPPDVLGACAELRHAGSPTAVHTAMLAAAALALHAGEGKPRAVPLEDGFALLGRDGGVCAVAAPAAGEADGSLLLDFPAGEGYSSVWEALLDHVHLTAEGKEYVEPVPFARHLAEALAAALESPAGSLPDDLLSTLREICLLDGNGRFALSFPSAEAAARACALDFRWSVLRAAEKRGKARVALSGGSTPAAFYAVLRTGHFRRLPWERVEFYFADERAVPPDHERSNYGLARRLLFEPLGVPDENVFRMRGEAEDARKAAAEYERALRAAGEGGSPAFDWVMLGAGPDGHTASLFPGSELLSERKRLAAAAVSPDGERRITLTLPVLNAARRVVFLAFGEAKRKAAAAIRAGDGSLPAAMVRPERGPLLLYADSKALPE